jgi:Ni/Co efflux regulator RcnB
MNNSKSRAMTLATAALALCMAGSAFAQDRRGDDHDQRGPGQRQEQQHNDRSDFRDGRQADRRGTPSRMRSGVAAAVFRPSTGAATTSWTTGAAIACNSRRAATHGWVWEAASCWPPSPPA